MVFYFATETYNVFGTIFHKLVTEEKNDFKTQLACIMLAWMWLTISDMYPTSWQCLPYGQDSEQTKHPTNSSSYILKLLSN